MESDDGSVTGCIDYLKSQKTCETVNTALTNCAVTAYPGTEPAGCP